MCSSYREENVCVFSEGRAIKTKFLAQYLMALKNEFIGLTPGVKNKFITVQNLWIVQVAQNYRLFVLPYRKD